MAVFESQFGTATDWDYHGKGYNAWVLTDKRSPRIEAGPERFHDIGAVCLRGYDQHTREGKVYYTYISEENIFGNAANSAAAGLFFVPNNRVGRAISEAASILDHLNSFHDPNLEAKLDIYTRARDKFAEEGYKENFSLDAVATGYVPDTAIGGVMPFQKDCYLFLEHRNIREIIKAVAEAKGYDPDVVYLEFLLHETGHMSGIPGSLFGEWTDADILNMYIEEQIAQIYNAFSYNQGEKVDLARKLRQIKEMQKEYKELIESMSPSFGGLYSRLEKVCGKTSAKAMVNAYAKEAMNKYGKNTRKGIMEYVSNQIEDYLLKMQDSGSSEESYKKKEGKNKKKGQKSAQKKNTEKNKGKKGSNGKSKKGSNKSKSKGKST